MSNNISTAWPMPHPKSRTRAPGCKGFPSHSRKRRCPSIARRCSWQVTMVSLSSKRCASIRRRMSLTTPEPSVPQKPLACQSAKFGIDVQSQIFPTRFRNRARSAPPVPLGWTCCPCPRLRLASAWTYATALGASPRNVRSVLSTCGAQLSLPSARRPV
jgi:hypothetical protein